MMILNKKYLLAVVVTGILVAIVAIICRTGELSTHHRFYATTQDNTSISISCVLGCMVCDGPVLESDDPFIIDKRRISEDDIKNGHRLGYKIQFDNMAGSEVLVLGIMAYPPENYTSPGGVTFSTGTERRINSAYRARFKEAAFVLLPENSLYDHWNNNQLVPGLWRIELLNRGRVITSDTFTVVADND